MLLTCLAKLFGSVLGILAYRIWPGHPYFQVSLLGIAPIWLEGGITYTLNMEPSREQRLGWRVTDNLVDALCFVLIPPLWLIHVPGAQPGILNLRTAALVVFIGCGLFRLWQFVQKGLQNNQFEGLPVTYTGYFWILALFLIRQHLELLFFVFTLLLSFAMVNKRIKIKPSR